LPKTPNCLKPGQLAKVIARGGRIVVGNIRYVGPIENETYVGLQLPQPLGDCGGSFNGKTFFEWYVQMARHDGESLNYDLFFYSESNYGIFVPYKKVVMAWN
jgi:dynactin complex subunit